MLSNFIISKNKIILLGIIGLLISCATKTEENIGQTIVTKWQADKRSAISITYDDGIINQLTVARPIMNKLGLPELDNYLLVRTRLKEHANQSKAN